MADGSQKHQRVSVLYFLNSLDYGGAEIGLMNLIRGGLFDEFDLHVMSIVRGSGRLSSELKKLNVQYTCLNDAEKMKLRHLANAFVRIRSYLNRSSPEVVIASLPQANILARLAAYWNRRVLLVSFEHNTHLAKRAYELAYRVTSNRVDLAFADSSTTRDVALRRLYRRPPLSVVVPLVRIKDEATEPPAPETAFVVVSAARFSQVKNQGAILRAIGQLRAAGHDVVGVFHGVGPTMEECRCLSNELGISDAITFAGFVEDWAAKSANAFVVASQHEGSCLALIEAMNAGMPALAPMIGGIRDYADHTTMIVLDDVSPTSIAGALLEVMSDKTSALERASRAKQQVRSLYGSDAIERKYRHIAHTIRTALRRDP